MEGCSVTQIRAGALLIAHIPIIITRPAAVIFAIDIVITYITVRNQMISTIPFNTAGDLHDRAQARIDVRGAGGEG